MNPMTTTCADCDARITVTMGEDYCWRSTHRCATNAQDAAEDAYADGLGAFVRAMGSASAGKGLPG